MPWYSPLPGLRVVCLSLPSLACAGAQASRAKIFMQALQQARLLRRGTGVQQPAVRQGYSKTVCARAIPFCAPSHTPHTPACSPLACMHARVRTCMHVRARRVAAKRRPLPPLYTENTVLFSMLARLIALVAHASHRHQPQPDLIPAGLLS